MWAYELVYAEESGAKTEKHKMAGSRQRTTSSDVTGAWSLRHRDKARRQGSAHGGPLVLG